MPKRLGVVRIQIVPNAQRLPSLESDLQKRFKLKDAVVVPVPFDNPTIILDMVAQAAASYLNALSPKPKAVGLSWGHTMAAMVRWVPRGWNKGVHVIALNGGTTRTSVPTQPLHVASTLAAAGDGYATILPVPGIFGLASTREALERDPAIADVLKLADQVPLALFAVGALNRDSVLVEAGNLPLEKLEDLKRLGGVGDILGRFIDREGKIVDAEIDGRTVGLHPGATSHQDSFDLRRWRKSQTSGGARRVVCWILQYPDHRPGDRSVSAPAAMIPILQVRKVTKNFPPNVVALRGVDLEIMPGESIAHWEQMGREKALS